MNLESEKARVFSYDRKQKKIMVVVQGAEAERTYFCSLEVCKSPACNCGTVDITFFPLKQGARAAEVSHQVEIDVVEQKLVAPEEQTMSEEEAEFRRVLEAGMNEADYQFLYAQFWEYKNKLTENTPAEEIDAFFDFDQTECDGLMHVYNDILPYGERLQANLEGKKYLIFDQYCLLSKCSCTNATLSFFLASEPRHEEEEEFNVTVNYKKKRWEDMEGDLSVASIAVVRSAIEEQVSDIYTWLAKRHKRLRTIYAACKRKHFRQQSLSGTAKSGRNDPCPCGSGKKYKKCCLKKDKSWDIPGLL